MFLALRGGVRVGGGYTVRIDELGQLIDNLDMAAERITAANNESGAHGVLGDLGNEALSNAGISFEDEWEYGIGKLGEAAEEVTDGLTETRKNYQEVEELHAEVFDTAAKEMASPPLINARNDPRTHARMSDSGEPTGLVAGGFTGGIQERLDGDL